MEFFNILIAPLGILVLTLAALVLLCGIGLVLYWIFLGIRYVVNEIAYYIRGKREGWL